MYEMFPIKVTLIPRTADHALIFDLETEMHIRALRATFETALPS
jgi:hypothetical protein